jgi:hypothetical protein
MATLKLSDIASGRSSAGTGQELVSGIVNQPNGVLGLNSNSKVSPVYLGTGVPSNSNYLRGDGSWNDVPAGGLTNVTFSDVSSLIGTGSDNIAVGNHKHDSDYIKINSKGQQNGVASLDSTGKVPLNQLPDTGLTIQEYASYQDFPAVGAANTIYLALDSNISYQWSGSSYAQVSGGGVEGTVPYNYYTADTSTTVSNLDVVNVETAGIVLTLPSTPENGFEVSVITGLGIIDTTVNPNGGTINGLTDNLVITEESSSVYLLYIDGWKTVTKTQVIQIGNIDNDEFLNKTDYWPDQTTYSANETTIYSKEAWEEQWELDSNILARQITIFDDKDNFTTTWVEKNFAVDKVVSYELNKPLPSIIYRKNNKITMCEILGIDWRLYETFSDFIAVGGNLRSVVQNQQVLDLIRESTSNWNDFVTSSALPLVQTASMTSANTPSGVVTASSSYEDFYAWRAFDKNDTSFWSSLTDADEWIAYEFPPGVNFFLHTFEIKQRDSDNAPKEIIIQRSTDGSNWVNHETIHLAGGPVYDTRSYQLVKADTASKYWRVYINSNYGGARCGIYELEFKGWNIA